MLGALKNIFTRLPKTGEPEALPKNAVPMPEAGEGAYVEMTFPAMTALEEWLGANYWRICEEGFTGPSALIISRALSVCMHGAEADEAPWGLSLREIGTRLYDAQIRAMRGITLSEAIAAVEAAKVADE